MRSVLRFMLAVPAVFFAATARAQSVAEEIALQQHRVESVDARVAGRLVSVDGAGQRTSYKFSLKVHGFPDGVRMLEQVNTPQPVRVLVRLEMNGRVTARLAHKDAAGKWVTEAAPRPLSDPLAGTGFALEDLVDDQFFWKEQSIAGHGTCGTRACVTLKSVSSAADHSQYASVLSSADEKTNALLHVVKTVRGSGAVKDITYLGLHQSHGVTSATQIEAKVSGRPGSSLVLIERGTAKANLTRADFDLDSSTLEDAGQQDPAP